MKKRSILFFAVIMMAIVSFVSCKPNEPDEAKVEFTLNQTSFTELNFAEPVQLTGTVTADKTITGLTFTGVKLENGVYTPKGDAQAYPVTTASTLNFDMEYFLDDNTITHIEVKVSVGETFKTAYISVGSIKGESKGSAFLGEIMMKADSIVWNGQNHSEVYTTPNTGAAATTPSFFSIHGVTIDGVVKHVLTGDEVRSVEGKNASFCFINCLQNTANGAYIGGQRGYMFSNAFPAQLMGGTTGRQCDIYEIGGKAIRQANVDTTAFIIIAGSWIGSGWNEARYKFVDSLFVVLGTQAVSAGAKAKAYYLLGQIQKKLDNSTLGEQVNPTSIGGTYYARRRSDAGTGATTTAMKENFRAGDYIILKNVKGGKLYYGIMQITQIFDDSPSFVNVDPVGPKIGLNEAKLLFHKPLFLNVKVQTQL